MRWVRIILRSLPMAGYLLALPCWLVWRVFPGAKGRTVTAGLAAYLAGIVLLQVTDSGVACCCAMLLLCCVVLRCVVHTVG